MAEKDLIPQVPGEAPAVESSPEVVEAPAKASKPKAAKSEALAKPEGLPDASTIDPDKITRAVLTRQGWIVPAIKPKV